MRSRGLISSLFFPLASFLAAVLVSSLAFAAAPDRISGPINPGPSAALAKSLHPKAQPKYDQGPVETSFRLGYITMLMAPSPTQQKALDLLLAQQQDRTSPNYHKWLTPQQFADRFGLSHNDFNKVIDWLASQGFRILSTGGGRNSVSFSGTAAQVRSAFGTEIHRYNIGDRQHFANSTPVLLPAQLSGMVSSVMGLHSFLPHPASNRGVSRNAPNFHPEYSDSQLGNLLAPDDIATMYDISSLYSAPAPIDGSGQKLAIVGQTDVYLADLTDFRSGFGLNQITGCATGGSGLITSCNSTYFQYVLVGTDPGIVYPCGDLGESDLDIEWSGAVARNAQIIFVNSPVSYDANCNPLSTSNGGVNASLNSAINPPSGPPLATVVSMSYGACEAEAGSLETLLQQGNVEGVTILNSSGDDGAAACDFSPPNNETTRPFSPAVGGLGVSYPASSPEVTGVGGTEVSLANDQSATYWSGINGANGGNAVSYIPEIPWNDDEAFSDFCTANASSTFCTQGGNTKVPGWVDITSAQTAQQDIWISAGGGGASNCFTESNSGICEAGFSQPSWQSNITSAPTDVRYVPDVSMLASPNFPGYIFCAPQSEVVSGSTSSTSTCANGIQTAIETYESIVGGTSASTPVFAGIVTLLNQYLGSTGLGNINPNLYKLAASSPDAFHHITSGDNNVYCQPNTPSGAPPGIICPSAGVFGYSAANSDSTTGYNLVNGLGSVDANILFLAWVGKVQTLTIASSGAATFSVTAGAAATVPITVTGTNGFIITNAGNSTTALPLTYTCTGLPSEANCTFSPSSTSSNTSITLSVTTTAPTAQLRRPYDRGSPIFYAALLPGLFGIVFAGSRKGAARGVRILSLIFILGFSTLWLGSCGGTSGSGQSNPGTPAGSSTITVNATTGGSNPITGSFQFTLVVTQ